MKHLKGAAIVALLLALSACGGQSMQLATPYQPGQYRVSYVNVTVTDSKQSANTAFTESLRTAIASKVAAIAPTDPSLPAIQVTVVVKALDHSTTEGYTIHSEVILSDIATKNTIGTFDENYHKLRGSSYGSGNTGLLGGLFTHYAGNALLTSIVGEEDLQSTQIMIDTYATSLANDLYPHKG